jgi:Zn-dependent peptidase ImmA (M78 family)/transcriptional regulator with XRE-family HTH domain
MTAFSENLRAARTMKGWSLQELADQTGDITKQSLHKYEQGIMQPDGAILNRLATVLEVDADYFFRANRLNVGEVQFRKKTRLTIKEISSIKERIRDYVERYLQVETLLRLNHTFNAPFLDTQEKPCKWPVSGPEDVEDAAAATLSSWQLGTNPIPNVTEMLEDNGVCVLGLPTSVAFNGLATMLDTLPVIVLNATDTPERRRFTALHELGHLVLDLTGVEEKQAESYCHRFASAMLLPRAIVQREFGQARTRIGRYELKAVKAQFGISVQAIMRRLLDLEVITPGHYKYFCIKIAGNRQEEGYGSFTGETAHSYRFKQLVHRLVAEDIVSVGKAATLAGMTLTDFRAELKPTDE